MSENIKRKRVSQRGKIKTYEEKQELIDRQTTEFEEDEMTLNEAIGSFELFQMEKQNSKATLKFYENCFKKVKKAFNDGNISVRVLEMDGSQLLFIKSLGDVSQQTINSYLRGYRALGNYCYDEGYIKGFKCPIKEIEPPVKEVYSKSEIEKLLKKPDIRNFVEYRNYCIILVLLSTGMRSNTLLNLKVDDVNINEGTIALNTTKAHKTIILHLDSKAKIELKQYINKYRADEDDEYLFISDYNEQLTRQGLSKAIANYNKRRGVEKTSIHLFRHTFAKNWITSGGDIITLAKVLTHSELEMVKRYSNLYDTDLKDKMKEHSTLSQMKTKSGKTMRTTRGGKE